MLDCCCNGNQTLSMSKRLGSQLDTGCSRRTLDRIHLVTPEEGLVVTIGGQSQLAKGSAQ